MINLAHLIVKLLVAAGIFLLGCLFATFASRRVNYYSQGDFLYLAHILKWYTILTTLVATLAMLVQMFFNP